MLINTDRSAARTIDTDRLLDSRKEAIHLRIVTPGREGRPMAKIRLEPGAVEIIAGDVVTRRSNRTSRSAPPSRRV